jgi:hypothetical protein
MPRRNSLKGRRAKTILRLPDLEQSKNAALHSLAVILKRGNAKCGGDCSRQQLLEIRQALEITRACLEALPNGTSTSPVATPRTVQVFLNPGWCPEEGREPGAFGDLSLLGVSSASYKR